jgi:hypothetical protein
MERSCLRSIRIEPPITGEEFYKQLIAQFIYCRLGLKAVYEDTEDPNALMTYCTGNELAEIQIAAQREIDQIVAMNMKNTLDYLFERGLYVTNVPVTRKIFLIKSA